MPDKKPDQYQTIAAQLWCLPQHGSKEMDCDFAQSIADALKQCAKEARREAFLEAAKVAQIEVNACRHHAQVTKGANKRLHEAAQGVAQFIVRACEARAAESKEKKL